MTSATDHLSGSGRFLSFAGVVPLISRANSLAVVTCTFIGSFPPSLPSIFLIYAAMASFMSCSLVLHLADRRTDLGRSDRAACGGSRGPCPLKIEATELARDIHHFSDEEEARKVSAFHGFAGEFVSIDPSGCHFCLLVTFRACRLHRPIVDSALELFQSGIGEILWRVKLEPAVKETLRQNALKSALER